MQRVISILPIILSGFYFQFCHFGEQVELNMKGNLSIPEGYVDLGLPSGTLWKQNNETKTYSYYYAIKYFDGFLPTSGQFQELINYCVWEWTANGCKVTGKNGESIFLSADFTSEQVGVPARYWSSTKDPTQNDCCFGLLFGVDAYGTVYSKVDRTCGLDNTNEVTNQKRSVILCKNK